MPSKPHLSYFDNMLNTWSSTGKIALRLSAAAFPLPGRLTIREFVRTPAMPPRQARPRCYAKALASHKLMYVRHSTFYNSHSGFRCYLATGKSRAAASHNQVCFQFICSTTKLCAYALHVVWQYRGVSDLAAASLLNNHCAFCAPLSFLQTILPYWSPHERKQGMLRAKAVIAAISSAVSSKLNSS